MGERGGRECRAQQPRAVETRRTRGVVSSSVGLRVPGPTRTTGRGNGRERAATGCVGKRQRDRTLAPSSGQAMRYTPREANRGCAHTAQRCGAARERVTETRERDATAARKNYLHS